MTHSPLPGRPGSARQFSLRVGLYFAALFVVFGVQLPYLPVWLQSRGLTAAEISAVIATPALLRLVTTPVLAFLADRSGRHGAMLTVSGMVALAAAAGLLLAPSFWTILAASALLGIALAVGMPMVEAIAMTGVRAAGLDYGRMRLWGSISFTLAGLAGGVVIGVLGPQSIQPIVVAATAASLLAGLLLPSPMAAESRSPSRRLAVSDIVALGRSPTFRWFLLAAATVQASHAVMYTFGSLHWQSLGISPGWIGTLWALGVVPEIVLFAVSGAAVRRFGPVGLLGLGAAGGVMRWTAMAADPGLLATICLQLLHALTYAASHIGAMHVISRAVPAVQAGTAQALYATITGGTLALAALAAGFPYARFGGSTYLAMALLCALSSAAVLMLWRTWDGGEIARPPTSDAT
jgi:PPP family 3-phenylpropionic acid transporter